MEIEQENISQHQYDILLNIGKQLENLSFTYVTIDCADMDIRRIIEFIDHCRVLNALKIISMLGFEQDNCPIDINPPSCAKQITRLCLDGDISLAWIDFFLQLFPHLEYVQFTDVEKEKNLHDILQHSLVNGCSFNQSVKFVSISIENENKSMIEVVHTLVRAHHFANFSIEELSEEIILKWNLTLTKKRLTRRSGSQDYDTK